MVAAQCGDSASYEKLLLELIPYLRGFVRRRLGDNDALEDVVQNVLVSLHRARHTFRGDRPSGPWPPAVARNAVIDQVRARARRRRREVSLEADGVPEPVAPEPSRENTVLGPDLVEALAALPVSQREAVEMIHVQGLSVSEAASLAGVSRAALKVRAHRGYRALRFLLVGRQGSDAE